MKMVLETDGAARGNPGPAAGAAVGYDGSHRPLFRVATYLGTATNNVAEYVGVISGLEEAIRRGAREVELRSDSELLVRQLEGRHPGLVPLHRRVMDLARRLDRLSVRHVPRAQNRAADAAANEAVDRRASFVEELATFGVDGLRPED
jgi:ribonuclease HI